MLARHDRRHASEMLVALASTVTCPVCGKVFAAAGNGTLRAVCDDGHNARNWVLSLQGEEVHRCPLPQ